METKIVEVEFKHGGEVSINPNAYLPMRHSVSAVDIISDGDFVPSMISWIRNGRRINIDGVGLRLTQPKIDNGWRISFSGDLRLPMELFNDPIDIRFGSRTQIGRDVGPSTLRVIIHHEEPLQSGGIIIPSSRLLMSQRFSAPEAVIDRTGLLRRVVAYSLEGEALQIESLHVDGLKIAEPASSRVEVKRAFLVRVAKPPAEFFVAYEMLENVTRAMCAAAVRRLGVGR